MSNTIHVTPTPHLHMLPIPGGQAWLGSDGMLEVLLPDFYLARYPVTNAQYLAFVEATGEHAPEEHGYPFNLPDHPVVGISWHDAAAYCAWLSAQTGLAFRLPSEVEWEYAARGGQQSQGFRYAGGHRLQEVGWYRANSHGATQPVGLKPANELGLHDLSGNVWEWCADHWHGDYGIAPLLPDTPSDGRPWLSDNADPNAGRVVRGGFWNNNDGNCRLSCRFDYDAVVRDADVGFRLARY